MEEIFISSVHHSKECMVGGRGLLAHICVNQDIARETEASGNDRL